MPTSGDADATSSASFAPHLLFLGAVLAWDHGCSHVQQRCTLPAQVCFIHPELHLRSGVAFASCACAAFIVDRSLAATRFPVFGYLHRVLLYDHDPCSMYDVSYRI